MFTTIITDCKGENEAGRQITRFNSLGLGPTSLIGIDSDLSNNATIEASANLIDVLDASNGKQGIVVLNVAPRGNKKDGENGTHFIYFHYKKTLVISTIKGYCLSMVKKFEIVKKVNLMELSKTLDFAFRNKLIDKNLRDYTVKSQFRSFDFVPRVTVWLIDKVELPYKTYYLKNIPEIAQCIWCIDTFGNCKTTILSNEISLKKDHLIKTNLGKFKFYERLKDIPKNETAIYVGSSGIKNIRFLEIATQGVAGSAGKKLNLKIGTKVKIM
ncbi:hypothetical protein A3D00_00510 [Candidatus Woesebacteria bacterium RIFCSPHIGHO2_02_FULL_38_9]|uniref:S-adenosyl-l-methionine hydroxide adenosyltransferase C-terminal domain-containing protein n=1 Tax=Candidatus Woesebacteria bacterium RIFCSPHIGHO2_01_FULL_39_28 TaxID=1802496 RepID=A0A1F7YHE8_9BACT|nr:MAG: hypothetical protein A2627_04190 [Candidatus Woesebacteria bacterium RIFCSPHIGHO2_01_FULL_39_28]OGM33213.1 MAG: hypothetical protein A3D00_00510 [Candidatus Woesebacteria bacterium RIFCSPHIGHO2_02_FULL_38_9]OGM58695.1 MAG: hypothetical protein A3A50_02845 [Candidatus Woesebacteria bacterium RIFCSPLOWO2_01_FULL_38_20]